MSKKEATVEMMAGSIAGSVGKVFEYPFDTTKVKLQAQSATMPRYSGAVDCMRATLREEGMMGLYRGLSAPMVAAAAENATLFTSFDFFARNIWPSRPNSDPAKALMCGSGSGLVASFVLTPIELVKCKIQVTSLSGHSHKSIAEHVRYIYLHDGIYGFWRGQTGTALREAGGSASWFGAYHVLKGAGVPTVVAGAFAGIMYNISLYPADTVKSRMQTESMMGRPRQNFIETLRTVLSESGVRGLYRGAAITCTRAAPSSAIIFSVFEALRGAFDKAL